MDKNAAQSKITELRQAIDELDQQISRLLLRRIEIAADLGNLKSELGMPVKDLNREESVMSNVTKTLSGAEMTPRVLKVYERILQESREAQHS